MYHYKFESSIILLCYSQESGLPLIPVQKCYSFGSGQKIASPLQRHRIVGAKQGVKDTRVVRKPSCVQ